MYVARHSNEEWHYIRVLRLKMGLKLFKSCFDIKYLTKQKQKYDDKKRTKDVGSFLYDMAIEVRVPITFAQEEAKRQYEDRKSQ